MPIGRMQLPRELRSSGGIMSIGDQGGMKNYLGNQPMVTAPKFWRSGPDSPPTELAYITDAEKDLIMRADLHGSLSQGPNEGPSGIMSLDSQGDYTRDRSPGAYSSGAYGDASGSGRAASERRARNEAHMKSILTGQKNIGQTVQTGPRTRQYSDLPEWMNVKQPDGTYKRKHMASAYKSYGQPSFLGNLFSRGAPGYRGIKGLPAFGDPMRNYSLNMTGPSGPGYYTDKTNFGEMRDAFPSFGIMGILSNLIKKFRKPRDMSKYNKLSLTAPEDQKVYIPEGMDPSMIIDNPFKNQDFNYGITNNPLTQKLMTKTSSPISNLQERLNIVNQLDMPLNYSASDLQARARRAMTQPGTLATIDPLGMGTVTSYDPYKEMYSTLPRSDIDPAFQNMITQVGWNTPQKGMVESLKDLGFSATDAYKKLSAQNKSKGLVFKDYPDPLQPEEFYDKWYGGSFDQLPSNKKGYQVPQEVDTQIQNIYKGYI